MQPRNLIQKVRPLGHKDKGSAFDIELISDFVAQFISTESENLKCEELESLNSKLQKWV